MKTTTAAFNARFEQGKTQQHRIAHTAPDRPDGVAVGGDTLDKHRINGDTDQNQQALKAYRKEGTEIVLPHVSGFPVGDGGKRDGCQTCE